MNQYTSQHKLLLTITNHNQALLIALFCKLTMILLSRTSKVHDSNNNLKQHNITSKPLKDRNRKHTKSHEKQQQI